VGAADGSVIARWISREALAKIPDAKKKLLDPYDQAAAEYPELKKQYDAEVEKRLALPTEAKINLPDLKMPIPPTPMFSSSFDAIIKPIIPFPIKGVIWYQGESNAMFSQGYQYRFYLEGMINEFRELWHSSQMPFIVVEIPRYQQTYVWADLRDSQKFVADKLKNVFLVTILELGELKEIHPPRKPEMAERLVLCARKNVYGEKDLVASGPVYKAMKIVGKTVEIEFDSLGGGLVSSDNMPLREFTIAGEDKAFYPAKAQIIGDKVVVSSERVVAPKAVRYAWRDAVDVNLFNKKGLSAGQFRTDDWKIPTQQD
ncbi:MAG: sialate O-acetylesterase, partial [Victivallaceae bacterium]